MNRRGFFRAATGIAGLALLPGTSASCRRVIGVDMAAEGPGDRTVVAVMDTKTREVVCIDGVEVGEGDALLLTNQPEPSRNGVYVVSRASR
jgi:hypothetical protein